jgi:PAS domain S-box-containing protein
LLAALPVAVYMTDAEGRITFYNQAAAEFWGCRPELGSSRWCGAFRLYWPDGRPLPHDQCPMATAVKTGEPVRNVEAVAERPDGTRVPFMPYPTPLKNAAGQVTGAINVLIELAERKHTAVEAARLAAIVASSNDAIVSKTLQGIITSWNAGATRIFGYEADEMIGQSILRIIPPHLHHEEQQILDRLSRGEHLEHFETVRVTKDGRFVDISLSVSPVRDNFGTIVGVSKVARDITERKQADKLQLLLIEELNHRVKNTLSTVQAIANQSLSRSRSPADFAASFGGRIQALARAHALLTQTRMRGTDIMELIREQVLLGSAEDARCTCSGPAVTLDAQATVQLGLVLHELATNARKYGALSVPGGRLTLSWEVRSAGARVLALRWNESGGPRVTAPSAHGFGTTLIEQTLQSRGGEATISYGAGGVSCEIIMPLRDEVGPDFGAFGAPALRLATPLLIQPDEHADRKGKRIIVVEDEPIVAMDLEYSLKSMGCVVIGPASTLAKARTLIAESACDAALLDVNLAGHSVDELATALTQKNVPFAFVTGYGRDALPRGFQDAILLSKPFNDDQLNAVVDSLLHRTGGVVPLRQNKL